MRKWFLFLPVFALYLASVRAAPQDEQYVLGPDSKAKDGVPRGQVVPMPPFHSTIYADTTRQWWLYVPAQYDPAKPACLMVFQDGGSSTGDPKQAGPWNATYVFDNLIAAGQMSVTIGVFISPGELPPKEPGGKPVSRVNASASIFLSLLFSLSRPFDPRVSLRFIWPSWRFQRWKLTSEMLCARHLSEMFSPSHLRAK